MRYESEIIQVNHIRMNKFEKHAFKLKQAN